jgi:hypothetical protein
MRRLIARQLSYREIYSEIPAKKGDYQSMARYFHLK